MMSADKSYWLRRAKLTAWKFNGGWLIQRFMPIVLLSGIALSILVLALRSAHTGLEVAGGIAAAILIVGLISALYLARRNFLSDAAALSRLDEDLRLHNRLTSAAAGVGEWPRPKPQGKTTLQWQWFPLTWPILAVGLLLSAAFLIPVPDAKYTTAPVAEPASWTSAGSRIEALKREELVEQQTVEELQKALDSLRSQPDDQWFSHQSLEAGDHLDDLTSKGMRTLQKELENGLAAMELARQLESSQLQALSDPLNQKLQEALQQMQMGALPISKEMLEKLSKLNASKISKLSPEDWQKLCESLKKGISTCSNGACKKGGDVNALLALLLMQQGGGIDRGPGTAPMSFSDNKTDLGTENVETMENSDMSHAAIGDLQGVSKGEHKVDKDQWQGLQGAGTVASGGSGGDAVWQQEATPEEQAVLQRFFK